MKAIHRLWAGALLLLCPLAGRAQTSYSEDFFLTDSPEVYRFNPAQVAWRDFIGTGRLIMNSRGNVGATTFLYDVNGKTVTALNKSVPANLFLSKLHKDNYALADYRIHLFSYGFVKDRNYHTAEINLRSTAGMTLPKDIFEILKSGINKDHSDLSNTRFSFDLYAELAYGWSRRLTDIVSVGARAKLLVGLSSLDADIKDFKVGMFEDNQLRASFEANLNIAGRPNLKGYDGGTLLNPGPKARRKPFSFPKGIGMAVDLGIAITPGDYLTLSASASDLGFLCWFYNKGGGITANFSPSSMEDFSADDIDPEQIIGIATAVADEINETAVIQQKKPHAGIRAIPFSFNLGLKYKMPFYDRLAVGLTGHLTTYRTAPYWETRLGATVRPLDWLDLSANFGYGTYGPAFGAMASFRIHRFHLYYALQNTLGGTIPRTRIPMKPFNRTLSVGLTYDL